MKSSEWQALRTMASVNAPESLLPIPLPWLQEILAGKKVVPDRASVLVAGHLLELLLGAHPEAAPAVPGLIEELTVKDLAAHYHRAPSTIRGWLEGGLFPGARRLRNREWRVPPAAVEALATQEREDQRTVSRVAAPVGRPRRPGRRSPRSKTDLSGWDKEGAA